MQTQGVLVHTGEMCRSIKVLRRPEEPAATREEIAAAALQYVRKISGFRKPSRANQVAFDTAVQEITDAGEKLLRELQVPKNTKGAPEEAPFADNCANEATAVVTQR